MNRRPLGIGIINLAYFLAKRGLKYDESAFEVVDEYAEAWSYYLIKASSKLARKKGACLLNNQTNQKVFTFARLANMVGAEPLYLNDLLIQVNDIPEQEVLAQIQVFAEEGLIQYANKNEVIITQKGLLEKDHINHN